MASSHAPTITAGRWKGRRLDVPAGLTTRPTRSLVRQALFNMLGPDVHDTRVLDLYSGSGALGLEALSRGAAAVVFVESDRRALAALRANIARCAPDPGEVILLSQDVRALPAWPGGEVDLVLADPPFPLLDALPEAVKNGLGVATDARLAYHGPSERPAPRVGPAWVLERTRIYGRSAFHLFDRA